MLKLDELQLNKIHRPTFLEGILWALAGIKDAAVVFHSPGGCYISQMQTMLSFDEIEAAFYTSNLSLGDLIYSGEEQLKAALTSLKNRSYRFLFVVDSLPSNMTKEDIKGIIKESGFKNIKSLNADMDKNLNAGRDYVFSSLIDLMKPAALKKKHSVNIIGPTRCMFNWRSDIEELRRILLQIGVEINTVLSADCTIDQIANATGACLNLCVYPFDCGVELAKGMKKLFKIPYIDNPVPIGFSNTALWLEKIAEYFSLEIKQYLQEELEKGIRLVNSNFVFSIAFDSKIAISAQNHSTYAVGISRFLKNELGIETSVLLTADKDVHRLLKKEIGCVLFSPSPEEIKKTFLEKSPIAILGSFYDFAIAKELGIVNFVYLDIPMPKYISTQSSPYMGFRGSANLVQQIENQIISNLFIDAKDASVEELNVFTIHWDSLAQEALGKIAATIPYFVRTVAIKKIKFKCEELAKKNSTQVDINIIKQVVEKDAHSKNNQHIKKIFIELAK
ncbi:MAG: nitrogenase component 1 [Candidatus Gygaella obscura]|nr:nitrogenase component 1 [Candidatus Gygaella obscura]